MNKDKLKDAIANNYNVLFIGTHGVGKTKGTLALWEELGYRSYLEQDAEKIYTYYNGPTVDIYEDIKGIPVNQDGKLVYIRPDHRCWDKVELVMIDEPNRANAKIVNALYELIQFRAINGQKLPNLKCVWSAMNPYGTDEQYTVEYTDNSFKDRFHLHFNVKAELNEEYFVVVKKIAKDIFDKINIWWKAIPEDIRIKEVSPRRIDYAIDVFYSNTSLEIFDVLPASSNPSILNNILQGNQVLPTQSSNNMMDINEAKIFMDDDTKFLQSDCLDKLKRVPPEVFDSYFPYRHRDKDLCRRQINNFIDNIRSITMDHIDIYDIFKNNKNFLIQIFFHRGIQLDIRTKAKERVKVLDINVATKLGFV